MQHGCVSSCPCSVRLSMHGVCAPPCGNSQKQAQWLWLQPQPLVRHRGATAGVQEQLGVSSPRVGVLQHQDPGVAPLHPPGCLRDGVYPREHPASSPLFPFVSALFIPPCAALAGVPEEGVPAPRVGGCAAEGAGCRYARQRCSSSSPFFFFLISLFFFFFKRL